VIPANIRIIFTSPETREIVLPDGENRTFVSSFVWTQYRNVTDGRTDSGYYSTLHCEKCGRAVKIGGPSSGTCTIVVNDMERLAYKQTVHFTGVFIATMNLILVECSCRSPSSASLMKISMASRCVSVSMADHMTMLILWLSMFIMFVQLAKF